MWSLVGALAEQVRGDCHRQGAWALLGEGTGARPLCPDTGAVLTKDDIFGELVVSPALASFMFLCCELNCSPVVVGAKK